MKLTINALRRRIYERFFRPGFSGLIRLFVFLLSAGNVFADAPGNSCGGVGGTIRSQERTIPQRGGGTLNAKIFAPDIALQTAPCPLIMMLPGGGAEITSVEWAAQRLAAGGYIVIITKPQSGANLNDYNTAAVSGIDFLVSGANPYLSSTDTNAVGAAGWSLGARVLTRTQEEDTRISAIAEWDNLAVGEAGDAGSPQCTNQPTALRAPRVPALGQASDTCIDGRTADASALCNDQSFRLLQVCQRPRLFSLSGGGFRQKPQLSAAASCFHLSRRPSKFRLYE